MVLAAHIAPRLSKLTVPSPSPIFTPFIARGLTVSSVYSESIYVRVLGAPGDAGLPSLEARRKIRRAVFESTAPDARPQDLNT
ncbi:hypothetical protein GSI_01745 [Ganoderma sinense ZZ0214-1]|uniref:Uncharacterized protein n=1 Tax=Ganoderma sinense ZZ0214-1 TaxID=1077348 RepID=A0A2G8SQP5_9APHY|nr:hypothetical protein GSI_01745 [Ganoderma sinense ZZ0214-1]